MKPLAFIASVLLATVLLVGGLFLIVVQSPHHAFGPELLAVFALTVLIYGPLYLGAMLAQWDTGRSEGSRRYFRVTLWIVLGLEALGVVAIVAYGVVVGAPVWLPALIAVGGAALTAVAVVAGRALMRVELARPGPENGFQPIRRGEVRRKVMIVAATFVGVFFLGFAVLGTLPADHPDPQATAVERIVLAVQLATVAAALAAIIVAIPLNRRLRDVAGGDLGTARKLGKVVLANKPIDLDDSERIAAAKYAALAPTVFGFMLGYISLLYVGLAIQQLWIAAEGRNVAISIGFTILLVTLLAFFVPYFAIRIRRARRYADDNAGLLVSADAPADD